MSPQLLSGAARLAGSSLLRLQSDERLVALVRDGHDPAFAAVVERYRTELLRFSERIVGESRAEDVVQQAFVNAHGAMTSSDTDLQLRPWLYRIAHNAALNVLRAARRTDELDERLAAAGGVEHDVETRERLRDALAAIARLPEPQRDALTLQAIQGRSHEEVALALGVTAGAARQHVHRARGAVRAAVTAVTPYGLMARFAMAGGGEPVSAIVSGSGAATAGAAGIGATVAKIGAGVIAAGAIATGTTGHVPFVGQPHKAPAHTRSVAASAADHPVLATAAPVTAEPATQTTGHSIGSASGRAHGTARHGASGSRHGRGGGSSDHHSSGGQREDHGGSGSEDSHRGSSSGDGSGSHHSGSGDSTSGSGEDSHHSGSGSDSGDDNVITAPVTSDGSRTGSDDGALDGGSSGSGDSSFGSTESGSGTTTTTTTSGDGGGTSGGDSSTSGSDGSDDRSTDDSLGD